MDIFWIGILMAFMLVFVAFILSRIAIAINLILYIKKNEELRDIEMYEYDVTLKYADGTDAKFTAGYFYSAECVDHYVNSIKTINIDGTIYNVKSSMYWTMDRTGNKVKALYTDDCNMQCNGLVLECIEHNNSVAMARRDHCMLMKHYKSEFLKEVFSDII